MQSYGADPPTLEKKGGAVETKSRGMYYRGGRRGGRIAPETRRSFSGAPPTLCVFSPPPLPRQPAPPTCLLAPPEPATGAFLGERSRLDRSPSLLLLLNALEATLCGAGIVSLRFLGTPRSCRRPGGTEGLELLRCQPYSVPGTGGSPARHGLGFRGAERRGPGLRCR